MSQLARSYLTSTTILAWFIPPSPFPLTPSPFPLPPSTSFPQAAPLKQQPKGGKTFHAPEYWPIPQIPSSL